MSAAATTLLDLTPRQAIDALRAGLGFSEDELAQALGASRRTVGRWRTGAAYPQQIARKRLSALMELQQRIQGTFRGPEAPRRWFHTPSRYMGGITPAEAVRVGRLDRVEAALEVLDSGIFL